MKPTSGFATPAAAILLALSLGLPLANGQAPEGIATDPAGDVVFSSAAGSVLAPEGTFDHVDLVAIQVTETEETFTFELVVAAIDAAASVDGTAFSLTFRHKSTQFRATGVAGEGKTYTAQLDRRPDGAELWDSVQEITGVGFVGNTIQLPIQRVLLRDEDAAAPFAGRFLDQFWATTSASKASGYCVTGAGPCTGDAADIEDRVPDSGFVEAGYPIQLGGTQQGPTRLVVDQPMRASNGEETTYLFEAILTNSGSTKVTYGVSVSDVPAGWNVSTPLQALDLASGATRKIPIVVATPFFHQHGGETKFKLTVEDISDPSNMQTAGLGVLYLGVPQPAGHHPTVWLHSRPSTSPLPQEIDRGSQVTLFMNTLREDDNDTGQPSRAQLFSPLPNETPRRWCVRLDSGLRLGLDFDAGAAGESSFTLSSAVPIAGTFEGHLWVAGADDGQTRPGSKCYSSRPAVEVATIPAQEFALAANQPITLAGQVLVTSEGDFVPQTVGNDLFLELILRTEQLTTTFAQDTPVLEPGAFLTLPLNEYHDPIEFLGREGTYFQVIGNSSVLRGPGSVAVFDLRAVDAENKLGPIEILGTRVQWASLVLDEKDPNLVHVLVRVPSDAVDGEIANLILRGETLATSDPFYARVVVEVDTDAVHEDDAVRALELSKSLERGSPGAGLGLAVMALACAVLTARRRK